MSSDVVVHRGPGRAFFRLSAKAVNLFGMAVAVGLSAVTALQLTTNQMVFDARMPVFGLASMLAAVIAAYCLDKLETRDFYVRTTLKLVWKGILRVPFIALPISAISAFLIGIAYVVYGVDPEIGDAEKTVVVLTDLARISLLSLAAVVLTVLCRRFGIGFGRATAERSLERA